MRLELVIATAVLGLATMLSAQNGAETPRQVAPNQSGAHIADRKMDEAKQRINKIGEHEYSIGDITINSNTREIRFPAVVNMTDGVLEYAIVHENGKTHESLLSTSIKPIELNLAMLLANYEAHLGEAAKHLPDLLPETKKMMEKPMEKPGANRIQIDLLWTDKNSKQHRVPLAEWVHDRKSGKPLVTPYWIYTGSLITEVGYAAEFEGSIVGIYFDIIAMMNCPVPGNASDEWWQVETKDVPELNTPVVVSISPFVEGDKASKPKEQKTSQVSP